MEESAEIQAGDLVYWRDPAHGYIAICCLQQWGKGPFTVIRIERGTFGKLITLVGADRPDRFQEFEKFLTTKKPERYHEMCDAILASCAPSKPRQE